MFQQLTILVFKLFYDISSQYIYIIMFQHFYRQCSNIFNHTSIPISLEHFTSFVFSNPTYVCLQGYTDLRYKDMRCPYLSHALPSPQANTNCISLNVIKHKQTNHNAGESSSFSTPLSAENLILKFIEFKLLVQTVTRRRESIHSNYNIHISNIYSRSIAANTSGQLQTPFVRGISVCQAHEWLTLKRSLLGQYYVIIEIDSEIISQFFSLILNVVKNI